jgi:hypothetical protein
MKKGIIEFHCGIRNKELLENGIIGVYEIQDVFCAFTQSRAGD